MLTAHMVQVYLHRIEVDLRRVLLLARDEITRHGQFHNDVQQQLKQQECSLSTLLALCDKDPLVSDVSSSDTVQTPPSDVQASGRLNGDCDRCARVKSFPSQ
jgi:hypothetical protein